MNWILVMRIHLFLSLSIIYIFFLKPLLRQLCHSLIGIQFCFAKLWLKRHSLYSLCSYYLELGVKSLSCKCFWICFCWFVYNVCVCVLLFRSYLVSLVIYLIKHLLWVLFLTSGKRNDSCLHGRSISMKTTILSLTRNYISSWECFD